MAVHAISRIIDDSKSDILAVNRFTSNPANKIPSNFSDLHTTLKFIKKQKEESDYAKEKILALSQEAVNATEAGLLQDALNLRNRITKLMPIAYAKNLDC